MAAQEGIRWCVFSRKFMPVHNRCAPAHLFAGLNPRHADYDKQPKPVIYRRNLQKNQEFCNSYCPVCVANL